MKKNDRLLLFGDFNIPSITWHASPDPAPAFLPLLGPASSAHSSSLFIDIVRYHSLSQLSSVSNFRQVQLDLIFTFPKNQSIATSTCTYVSQAPVPILQIDPHHPPLELSLRITGSLTPSNRSQHSSSRLITASSLDFRKTDFNLLNSSLSNIDWSQLYSCKNVNVAVSTFTSLFLSTLPQCCPKRNPPRSPPWSDATSKSLKRDKSRYQRAYWNTRSVNALRTYKYAATAYRLYNRTRYNGYILILQTRLRWYPRAFWKFMNARRKGSSLPSTMHLESVYASSPEDICSLFRNHFLNIFSPPSQIPNTASQCFSYTPQDVIDVSCSGFDEHSVSEALSKLKPSFSAGPDGIPPSLLKKNC